MAVNFEQPQMYRWKDPNLPPAAPALQVYFLQEPHVNHEVTAQTGVQTYDNVVVAYISPMGNSRSNVAHEIERTLPDGTVKVNQFYAAKYGEQLKLYKSGMGSEATGTPLRDLVGMTPATAMSLRARGIHTVEMLSDMGDGAGNDLMGFWDLRDKARKHIELREKNAPTVRLEAELAERDATIASLQRQMDEFKALLDEKTKPKKAA
jgi:hypothetical protein